MDHSSMIDAIKKRFLDAQLAGDRAQGLAVIEDAVAAKLPIASIHIDVIQDAQYEVGRLWETNAINIAMEHQATAIAQLALASLYPKMPRRARNGKRVLIACVEGELHDMGARISADFLEMEGYDVRFLGASVPPASLAEHAVMYQPDLVALSATMAFHLPALKAAVDALRKTSLGRVPILAGGLAVSPDDAGGTTLDIQGSGADANALVHEANRVLGRPHP